MIDKNISKILFKRFKEEYSDIKTIEELKVAKRDYKIISSDFGIYESVVSRFIELKEKELKKEFLNSLIKPIEEVEPLKFNLKGLNDVKNKISKLDNVKLKYEFKGLFNLLSDSKNLIYNPLGERKRIIKDLNKFKSLKFFKVGYISRYNLKNEYKRFTYKNDANQDHTKIYFIKNGLYLLKTVSKDDIHLKVFYIGQKYKILLKPSNTCKKVLKGEKFNLSCIDAYKTLDKKDNIKYYSFCNKNGLGKTNRKLLKEIRRSKKPSKDSLIDYLEDRRNDILEDMKISSELEVLYLEIELQDIDKKLQELKTLEEDNSMEDKTFLSDYF